ncbi:MAG: TIGR03905 family TSCPD domain-containing protein [Anaerorhabdus sp.]
MSKFTYKPDGVCAQEMTFEYEGDVITAVNITAGCSGNLQGICKLIEGRKVEEVVSVLEGIRCGTRNTSCPDQIAQALKNNFTNE